MSDPAYRLLLELAGRVDDDLLAAGRELVAVGEEGHALELLVAELVAGRVELPGTVRLELVAEAAARRVQPDADRCLPRGTGDGPGHRFTGSGPGGPAIAAAVAAVPELADGALAWRTTPAGAAPGALPHPVLLARAGDGGSAEVVTYRGQVALTRSGLVASVEVQDDRDPHTDYHRAAWAASIPVRSLGPGNDADAAAGARTPPSAPFPASRPAPAHSAPPAGVEDAPEPDGPAPGHDPGEPDRDPTADTADTPPTGVPTVPAPTGAAGPQQATDDLPAGAGTGPAPGAGPFDDGPTTPPAPAPDPASDGADPAHPAPRPSPPIRALREASAPLATAGDWFGGTPDGAQAPSGNGVHEAPRNGSAPAPPPSGGPAVPTRRDEDVWARDWASGAWAGAVLAEPPSDGPSTARREPGQPGRGDAGLPNTQGAGTDAPTPAPGVPIARAPAPPPGAADDSRRPRHLLFGGDTTDVTSEDAGTAPDSRPDPQDGTGAPGPTAEPAPGTTADPAPEGRPVQAPQPSPDTLAERLSPTEQQLLARLHDELDAREGSGEPTPRNGTARQPGPGPE